MAYGGHFLGFFDPPLKTHFFIVAIKIFFLRDENFFCAMKIFSAR